jgi:hypothetical protein
MSVKLWQSVRYGSAELLEVGCLNGWYAINCAELMKKKSASVLQILLFLFAILKPTEVILFLG